MSWIRVGDTFNGAPEFMRAEELAAEREDARLVAELKGHTLALFTYSAQQWTDYEIGYGTLVNLVGLTRAQSVTKDLITIGVLEDVSTDSERKYKLVERESFVHIIKSTDRKMAAKRKRDQNKGSLQVTVLLRDGDQCRYCGVEVNWKDRKNDDGGTYDHREPDEETTPDNYVVACRGCNLLRFELGQEADLELPLLDPPEEPIYGSVTREKLKKWRRMLEKVCRQMGIPNPLEGGKSHTAPVTSRATNHSVPTTQPPAPADSQSASAPRLPAPGNDDQGHGRDAKEETHRHPAASEGMTTTNPFRPEAQEQSGHQPARDPQRGNQSSLAHDAHAANASTRPVRKRRRARRRNR